MPKGKKYKFIRALLKMQHSPAGHEYLKSQARKKESPKKKIDTKAETKPTYFRGKAFDRPTIEHRLSQAGVTKENIKKLKGKK